MKRMKKILSLMICCAMLVGYIPAPVFVEAVVEEQELAQVPVEEEVTEEPVMEEAVPEEENAEGDSAADAVRSLIDALPSLEEIQEKPLEDRQADYNQVQEAYEAYCALSEEEQSLLPPAEEIFGPYFAYFNGQTQTTAVAEGTCGENLTWSFDASTGTLTISGTGAMDDYSDGSQPWYIYQQEITSLVIEGDVTRVGDYAFTGCTGLTGELMLPDCVAEVGQYAFSGCTGLTSITLGKDLELLDLGAFDNCTGVGTVTFTASTPPVIHCDFKTLSSSRLIFRVPGRSYKAYVEAIDEKRGSGSGFQYVYTPLKECGENLEWSFDKATGILTISGSGPMVDFLDVKEQPWCEYQSAITGLEISEGVTTIGKFAFQNCSGLSGELSLPNSLTSIGHHAFYGCSGLTGELHIPEDVTAIGGYAFMGCTGLTGTLVIPDNVTNLDSDVFSGCVGLTGVDIGSGVKKIPSGAFADCTGLVGTLVLPDTVTSIGSSIIVGCTNLDSLVIGNGVKEIPDGAFFECSNLKRIDLGKVTTIGYLVFYGCTGLEEITFRGNAPSIEDTNLFDGITATVYYPANDATWDDIITNQYYGTITWVADNDLHSHNFGENQKCACGVYGGTCGDNLTWTLDTAGTLTISGTGDMNDYSRSTDQPWCYNKTQIKITDVVMESGVTSIGSSAFAYFSDLTEIHVPEGVTKIGKYAFEGCDKLKDVWLPASLESVGRNIFLTGGSWSESKVIHYPGCIHQWYEMDLEVQENINYADFDGLVNTNLDDNDCTTELLCSVCGGVDILAKEQHTGGTATCQSPAKCAVCGMVYGGLGGHTEVIEPGVAATCTTDGLTESSHCSVCKKEIKKQEVIPAGHKVVDGVCTGCNAYGECGDAYWKLSDDRTMTFYGAGAIQAANSGTNPAFDLLVHKVIISEGITDIGPELFGYVGRAYIGDGLQTVEIASTVKNISANAFANCGRVESITFAGDAPAIEANAFARLTAKVYYPAENDTWTSVIKDTYGGNITWIAVGGIAVPEPAVKGTVVVDGLNVHSEPSITAPVVKTLDAGTVVVILQTIGEILGDDPAIIRQWGKIDSGWIMMDYINLDGEPGKPENTCGDNLTWSFDKDTGTLTISGTGEMYDYASDSAPWAVYSKEIKKIIIENGVTGVGNYAFYGCDNLLDVYIPQSLTTVGDYGLRGRLHIDQTVRQWYTVEMGAHDAYFPHWDGGATFRNDAPMIASGISGERVFWELNENGTMEFFGAGDMYEFWATASPYYELPIKNVVVGEGITNIGMNIFEVMETDPLAKTLESVTIASTVKRIETTAFAHCKALKTITFVGNAPAIGADSFWGVTATAFYPGDNGTWTAAVMQDYEGNITWVPAGAVKNRVEVKASELEGQTSLWIDGREYAVTVDGDMAYVDLPDSKAKTAVVYTYHVGDSADVHTQYPVSMKVWMLKNTGGYYTAERTESFDDILQYSGMSIRVYGRKGIRMITSMEKNKKTALTSGGLDGYTLKEYGTVIAWANQISSTRPLTLGQSYVKYNYAYKKGIADPVFAYSGSLMQYTNVLVNFTNDQCKNDLAMRPYMILENESGERITLYGGIVRRSIGYIAYQNRKVFEPGSDEYEYVWEIIRYVYGTKYDEDYRAAWSPPAM